MRKIKAAGHKGLDIGRGLLLPSLILSVWWVCSSKGWLSPKLFPSPALVFKELKVVIGDGSLLENLGISFARVLKGFALGASAGFILGSVLGLSRTAERLIGPVFNAIRQVPLPAWIPLLILVSIGELSRVAFIAIGASYPVALNTFEGIRSVRMDLLEVGRVFRFDRAKRFLSIILPSAFPTILTGLKLSLGVSWTLVVGAEIFTTSGGGIGEMMWVGRELSNIELVVIGIVTIALVGFAMNLLIATLERTFSVWRKTMTQGR
ncbi:MAG TPA: ABC transporter permease [Candidatus Deferrimicrobiaceae bacterium]